MKELLEHRYMPRYRLPRLVGCLLGSFFTVIIVLAVLVFIAAPLLLAAAQQWDSSQTAPVKLLPQAASLSQGDLRLSYDGASSDGEGYLLQFSLQVGNSMPEIHSFYYLPGVTEIFILPRAGTLRVLHLDERGLQIQWWMGAAS